MSDSSGEKKQLGKIMLQQKLVSAGELEEMLVEQQRDGSRLASSAARNGHVSMAEALGALSEQHGVPAIDLTRHVMPLAVLRLIPRELAEERVVLPCGQEGDQLVLAMASPGDSEVIEELAFVAGKSVAPQVALYQVLRAAIDYAYDRLDAGDEYYVGAYVTAAELAERGLPDLERAPQPLPPDAAQAAPASEHDEAALAALPLTDDELLAAEALPAPPPAAGSDARAPSLQPLDEAFAQRTAASKPPVLPTHDADAKVLIVDTSDEARQSLRQTLQETGIAVFEAADTPDALELVHAHRPKVLVIDPQLPSMHGLELCRRVHESDAQLPVIVVTSGGAGWRVQHDLRDALGVRRVFEKPVDLIKLTRTVRLLLEGQQLTLDPPELRPESEARWNAGMSAFERGDLDAAIGELEAGVKLDPEAFELQYHLALLYGQRGDLFAAMAALEVAVCLQPTHFSALKNLAVIYQRAGFRRQALDVWERVLEVAPDQDTRGHIRDHMIQLLS